MPGETLGIVGESGSGKSTLARAIIGTLPTASGKIIYQRRVGILFQDDLLFPHLSVADNLAFGLSPGLKGRKVRSDAIEAALDEIGLPGFGPRDPATLSGGQRARISLMRMLLSEPCALLLDEPFSRLDADRRAQIRSLVFDHATKRGLPVVLVTHDVEDAEAAGGPIHHLGA
ncbi:UNVERIFIED_CONTAM: hypothetical protein GTU68_018865 [Idotea baltica]|nr:hypothetical protein [Idotea baltica]